MMRDVLDEETRVELGKHAVFNLIPMMDNKPALWIPSHTIAEG